MTLHGFDRDPARGPSLAGPALMRRSGGRRPNPVFTPEYRALIDVLIRARRRSGLSQRSLSERLGKAQSHICMIERGQRRVDSLELCHIAQAIGAEPAALFGEIARAVGAAEAAAAGAGD